jgi:signal transduction histidine kinase
MVRQKTLITYLGIYFFAISTAVRFLGKLSGDLFLGPVAALLAIFFLLLAVEPWLSRRSHRCTHLYLVAQTGIVIVLAMLPPANDYFASLFFSLALQAMVALPLRTGFRWIGAFTVVMSVFMLDVLGWVGSPLILIYAAAYFFFGSYAAFIRQAETAQGESQKLLSELQTAHQQLQLYTAQAEELAVVQERNRLARNLHDSVTQTIFTMTLTAEVARILFNRDPVQAKPQLDRLQELAKSALGEMRSLLLELRPTALVTLGLIPALRRHIAMLERQYGLIVVLRVRGEPSLPDEQAQRLFWVIQEALNNVVKHARVDKASVTLQFEGSRTYVQIEDGGRGFEPEAIEADGKSMGLSSMRERVEMMGGTLTLDSRPGEGTCVTVEVTSAKGGEDSG